MRYRRETDAVGVVLLLVAAWLAFVAWWTALGAEPPEPPSGMGVPDSALEAWSRAQEAFEARELARVESRAAVVGLAATGLVLLVASRSAAIRRRAPQAAAFLLLVAVTGTVWSRVMPVWGLTHLGPELAAPFLTGFAPLIDGGAVALVASVVLAAGLRRSGTTGEAAAGGVLAWGAVTLVWVTATPEYWGGPANALFLRSDAEDVSRIAAPLGACLAPAAAFVLVRLLSAPPAGRDEIVARCRGACAVVAVLLLVDAAACLTQLTLTLRFDTEPNWWAAPHGALLLTAAAAAALAAVRWSAARVLVPAAAATAIGAVVLGTRVDPEWLADMVPAPLVTDVVAPVVLAACVLLVRRLPDRPREPAPLPAPGLP